MMYVQASFFMLLRDIIKICIARDVGVFSANPFTFSPSLCWNSNSCYSFMLHFNNSRYLRTTPAYVVSIAGITHQPGPLLIWFPQKWSELRLNFIELASKGTFLFPELYFCSSVRPFSNVTDQLIIIICSCKTVAQKRWALVDILYLYFDVAFLHPN